MSTRESEMKKVSLESAVILSVGEQQDPAASLCWMGLHPKGFSECGAWYLPSEYGSIASTVLCWVLFIFVCVFKYLYNTAFKYKFIWCLTEDTELSSRARR